MESKETVKSDEVGSMEKAFGENDSMFSKPPRTDQAAEEEVDKLPEPNQNEAPGSDEGTVNDAANDHRLSAEKPKKDVPEEVPIKYLKSLVNGRVFPVSEDLIRRKDLIPCDENGKKIYDHRKIGRFS